MSVAPLSFAESQQFLTGSITEQIQRYSVSGGMAMYLSELGSGGSLQDLICKRVLNPRSALFNDPREVLEEEFAKPGTFFSLLEKLSHGEAGIGELATDLKLKSSDITAYLDELAEMRLIRILEPVGSKRQEKRYRLADHFMRFWFRFVFGFQEDLEAGLSPADLYANEVSPALPGHTAPVYEELAQEFVRRTEGLRAGSWWGKALDEHRLDGSRMVEEVDIVGTKQNRVHAVGECKWTNHRMNHDVLNDLEQFKLPALRKDGGRLAKDLKIFLFSKGGFSKALIEAEKARDDLTLVDLDALEKGLKG
jgi:hypothetical protein